MKRKKDRLISRPKMKFRIGFVSNSSSVSFAIWGMQAKRDNIKDIFIQEKMYGERKVDTSIDAAIDKAKTLGLEVHWGPDDWEDELYVGRSLYKMRDDETYGNFKKDVEKILTQVFKEVKCEYIEEGYYDG